MKAQISKIKITNRIRKEVAKIAELSEDIRVNGLINPVAVMSLDDVGEYDYQLLAGLRRLRAIELIGLTEIDITVLTPADAEAILMIEISENEQREEFTFSEKMDFARMLEEVVKAKAKERMLAGKKSGDTDPPPHGAEGHKGETREIVADKIGIGKTSYDRAKYIADNAPDDVIDELDKGERTIRGTYDELKSKEKAAKQPPASASEGGSDDSTSDAVVEPQKPNNTQKSKEKPKPSSQPSTHPNGLLSKADEEAIERNEKFAAMSDAEKVEELQSQLKKERTRAATAESELARLKELRHNDNYHKDGIIANLQTRLDTAEARVDELEALHGFDGSNGSNTKE